MYIKIVCCLDYHSRFWLTTATVVFGFMRTTIGGVNICPSFSQFLVHPLIEGYPICLGIVTSRNARLIGDDDNLKIMLVQQFNGFS